VQIPCGRGSVLLWRRCDMLWTSGFTDGVTFGRSGPYDAAWLTALRYRGTVWCRWMLCLVLQFGEQQFWSLVLHLWSWSHIS